MTTQLCVIIVNYRTPALVVDALASLAGELDPARHRAVVVDNDSGDGSADRLTREISGHGFAGWARVLRAARNRGFAAGNNLGMRAEPASLYLLLNSDAYVRRGAIAELLRAAEAHPKAGIVSPRLEWPDGSPQISCFRDRSPVSEVIEAAGTSVVTRLLGRWDVPLPVSDVAFEPPWTSFACVLLRRELVEAVGGMDDGYFMYFDDIDYCRRARAAGYGVLHWPRARVVHLRGGSSPVKARLAARERPPLYYYEARARYFAKFYGHGGLVATNLLWGIGRAVAGLRERFGRKRAHACEGEGKDIWHRWHDPLGQREEGLAS